MNMLVFLGGAMFGGTVGTLVLCLLMAGRDEK